ncbi:hypothetical protein GCM10027418_15340 [Mariniluteicoccus endophyticus]
MPELLPALTLAVVASSVTAYAWPRLMTGLPEPDEAPDKIPYRRLAGRTTTLTASGLVGAAVALLAWVPLPLWPVWLGVATIGVWLAVVDGATTWLPLRLTQLLWAATAAGALALSLTAGPSASFRSAGAALGAGVFFWLFWRLGGGIGFGDVRLAPALAAAAGSVGPTHAMAAVLLGTLVGALHGVVRTACGRRGAYAYGPSLVAGPWLAVAVLGG